MDKEKVDRLLELKQLLDAGILTEEEMNNEKKKVLSLPDSDKSLSNATMDNSQEPALSSQNPQPTFEKITIHGYEGFYLIHPNISVYSDGKYIGEVGHNEELEIETDGDCLLKFVSGIKSESIRIRKGIDTHVFLYINRFTGGLNALKSGDSDYYSVEDKKNTITSNANIYTIIFVIVLFLLYWLLKSMLSDMSTIRF